MMIGIGLKNKPVVEDKPVCAGRPCGLVKPVHRKDLCTR